MVATAERLTSEQKLAQANCTECLTRDCPMSGLLNFPVALCNTFRTANCAFCAKKDCVMNGRLNAPVMDCNDFSFLTSPA